MERDRERGRLALDHLRMGVIGMRRSLIALAVAALLASPAAAQITPYAAGPDNQSNLALIAPTPATAANNNQIATTAWVNNLVNAGLPLASGKIWIGSVGNVATAQTPSGDLTVSNAGVFTFGTVNANVGTFGSATLCPTVTVNAKGLITAASAATCTPAVGSITGLGAGIATWLATPSSANLRAALTDESGTGVAYFQGGDIGTPSAGVATNLTGTAAGLTAGTFTAGSATNLTSGALPAARMPALTGDVTTTVGTVATTLAAGSASNLNSGTLAVARGGVDQTAYSTWSPTFSTTTVGGTPITASTSGTAARFKQIGKIVYFSLDFQITNVGVGNSGQVTFTLPVTAFNASYVLTATGKEVINTSKLLAIASQSTTTGGLILYDGTTAITVNNRFNFGGFYEAQ